MTEEQKKKCEEIINSCCKNSFLLCYQDIMRITISLAKLFNKDITKEKTIDIYNKFYKDISSFKCNSCLYTFWEIANYFDNDNNKENKNNE